jgi:predicted nucleotidyltransferase
MDSQTHFPRGQLAAIDKDIIVRRLTPLLAGNNVRLKLFGSRARGDAGSRSDIDLATVADSRLPVDMLANIREALEESPIPFRVDVVDYQSAPPALKQAIDREGIEWIG